LTEAATSVIDVVNSWEDEAISCVVAVTAAVAALISFIDVAVSVTAEATSVVFAVTCSMEAATSLIEETISSAEVATEAAWMEVSLSEAATSLAWLAALSRERFWFSAPEATRAITREISSAEPMTWAAIWRIPLRFEFLARLVLSFGIRVGS
jgi:hypothetical protein